MPLWFRFVSILIISLYFQCLITRLLTSTLNIKGLFPGALFWTEFLGKPVGRVELQRAKEISRWDSSGLGPLTQPQLITANGLWLYLRGVAGIRGQTISIAVERPKQTGKHQSQYQSHSAQVFVPFWMWSLSQGLLEETAHELIQTSKQFVSSGKKYFRIQVHVSA